MLEVLIVIVYEMPFYMQDRSRLNLYDNTMKCYRVPTYLAYTIPFGINLF